MSKDEYDYIREKLNIDVDKVKYNDKQFLENQKEFRQLLSVETSAEVATINPFDGLQIDENRFDVEFLKRIAPQASISMGLATRKVDDK